MSVSLSLCCMSAGPPGRTAAILRLLRPHVDEVVLALDDRIDTTRLGDLPELADRVLLYAYADPAGRGLAWLYGHCGSDWIFQIDDDEVPSADLLGRLRSLPDSGLTHAFVARRWLFQDESHWLADAPWTPDHQLRIVRNDPLVQIFPGKRHVILHARGPARFVPEPLYHLDCVLSSPEQRAAKAARYERERPGLRVAGRALNEAYYLPESRPNTRLEAVPEEDLELIREVLTAAPVPEPRHARERRHASREEVDALWSQRPWSEDDYGASIRIVSPDTRFAAGDVRPLELEVTNLGAETWPWGRRSEPKVRVSYHWRRDHQDVVRGGTRTPLPHPVRPGQTCNMLVWVEAPGEPGRYALVFDLVREHVRWFGCETTAEAEVRPRRRVGVLVQRGAGETPEADEETARLLARLAEVAPELEPVVLGPRPDELHERFGHAAAEGPREPLLSGIEPGRQHVRTVVLLLWRAARLGKTPFGRKLPTLEAIAIAPLDEQAGRLELWLQATAARTAQKAGVRVVLTHRPSERRRSLLARWLARTATDFGLERLAEP